ncbi:MAG: FHA domain-containing protein [Terracidiphilus sp.]
MVDQSSQAEATLDVIAPDGSREKADLTRGPYNIGRGGVGDNTLQLSDGRISRNCATITPEGSGFRLQDRGNRYGVFVNGAKIDSHLLRNGDTITFGIEDSYRIVFHTSSAPSSRHDSAVANLLTRIGSISDLAGTTGSGGIEQAQSAA